MQKVSSGRSFLLPLAVAAICGLLALSLTTTGCRPAVQNDGGDRASAGVTESAGAQLSDDQVRGLLDDALEFTCEGRRLNLTDHAAWQIVHGALAFGRDFKIVDRSGNDVRAIDYLLAGGAMEGWKLKEGVMLGDPPRPGLRAIVEAGSKTGQGHADQWLGYLADIGFQLEQEIKTDGHVFTLEDYLRQIEYDVPYNVIQEYSWTLMALATYRPSDYEWTAGDGNRWSIARLLEIEVNHELETSACGGSHRMAGVVTALNARRRQGGAIEGPWKAAEEKIAQCIDSARRYQNPDGSLSTNWFQRPGSSPDIKERLGCTGHVLEFVIMASTDEQLRQPWIKRGVVYLCQLLNKTRSADLECGALYHAAHGLVLYRQRMFGPKSYVHDEAATN